MKPYPEYKPTGLAWLPEIPRHWKCAKIRELFTERIQKVSDKEFAPLSVSKGGIVPQIATVAKTDNGDNRKRVKVGDFVINSRSDRKGSSGISAYDGSVSLINIVLNPRAKENGRFLHYLLKSIPFTEEYYRNGRGIVADLWTTRYSEMKAISVPVPPADEQAQIVRYLDAMTAKINKLIRAKKRQIALLQEQKQAIINQAVTRGLDPDVELKDSGIDWLGPIPKHWEIVTLKRLCSMHSGTNLTSEEIDELGIYPVYGGNGFRGYYSLYNCSGECVLVGRQGALAGNVHYVDGKFWATDHALITRCSKLTGYLYLSYLLKAMNLNQYAFQTAAQPGLAAGTILSLQTVIPSCEEQFQISDFLDSFCKKINDAIETTEKQISHCEEYKNSLISSVVTGQVDVRNIAVEEVDPADLITDDVAISSDDDIADLSEESPTTESEE